MADASGGKRTVQDIMSAPVMTASSSEPVADAAARMVEAGVGSVVIVEDGRPVGILTERDLVRVPAAGLDAGSPVSEGRTKDPGTI